MHNAGRWAKYVPECRYNSRATHHDFQCSSRANIALQCILLECLGYNGRKQQIKKWQGAKCQKTISPKPSTKHACAVHYLLWIRRGECPSTFAIEGHARSWLGSKANISCWIGPRIAATSCSKHDFRQRAFRTLVFSFINFARSEVAYFAGRVPSAARDLRDSAAGSLCLASGLDLAQILATT